MRQAANRYTATAMALHWLVAVLMVGNVVLIWSLGLFPDDGVRPAIDTHKSIGLTALGLALLRVLWRLAHTPPPLPRSYPALERAAAHAAHLLLYLLMLGLPISGWVMDSAYKDAASHPLRLFGIIPWFRLGFIQSLGPAVKQQVHDVGFAVHADLGYALIALFVLHVAGALKHQFVDGHGELGRMLPWGRAG